MKILKKISTFVVLLFLFLFIPLLCSRVNIVNLFPTIVNAQTNPNNINLDNSLGELLRTLFNLLNNKSSDHPSNQVTPIPDDIHNSAGNLSNSGQPDAPNVTIGHIPPPSASKLTKILFWANVINLKLIAANIVWPPWFYFHKLVNPPSNSGYTGIAGSATSTSNLYWCTFLVIDAFNLSGLKGLTTAHSAVLNMIPFFMNTPGYTFIPYSVAFSTYSPPRYRITNNIERRQSLTKVQPGCTTFFQSNPGVHERNHVAIIKTKVLDSNFNGYIETYDSNNTVRIARYPIKNGNIENTLYVPDSLRGFGCPI